jgi:arginase family enzyme
MIAHAHLDSTASPTSPPWVHATETHSPTPQPRPLTCLCFDQMRGFDWLEKEQVPRLPPPRLAYVGLRDLDPGEKAFIRALGIKAYTMHEVDKHGIGKVSERGGWFG